MTSRQGSPRDFELFRRAEGHFGGQSGQFDTSCWIHRLIARARLAQGDAPAALIWIDRALADDKGISRHDEFLELRYEIRRALGEADALDDLKAAVGFSAEGRRRTRLHQALIAAIGSQPS